ncbi:bifunctional methylenetetrahydrofolate dehydrogenase/methenyltetrahydrofolate cyclohydrolase FolD [Limosilactobacillus fastidiosus]|uniref:Bifunctional protein FolD n=1 Tax=Limosilactobacillus fastidiosus TaxID=2759855 RepID=A0A7W3YCW6_9LACO|nr:bifunctional methylenetetrahydrofolate dehydrogenase/methenyltetrahydrofolate cyclohydrolase FolD [Limosilactobacillus fastidiosus]MBB1063738.1 bifunctional methylenetetrahydrofolate dehydrogenase/methenyltetrahydrofolate cyclohydrolase FolD [Limosilactobacillus fastidiosus]MBB1086733.1 bifunctional methylenetetrahydrofolate dehydrogenase/methenyltetrahydrofolate cyclohydrolase FolD [Limosilactobacillus fastidiosus]MCD7084313.1 bifunctional methylenetetrahydrofolate dehydrogenase/methenyltetr
MATLIDGRTVAKEVNKNTAERVKRLANEGIVPGLAVILVGDDPASKIYTRMKDKKAKKLGIHSVLSTYPEDIRQDELLHDIRRFNADENINGILIQEPLPKHLDGDKLLNAIDPGKDVDGFHPFNVGCLYNNVNVNYPVSCTPRGIMTLLKHYRVKLDGARALVIGRSILVGKPMAALLENANATVTVANSHTQNLTELTKQADILIVAAGVKHLITGEMVKQGAVVIDVGMHRLADKTLTGDVDFDSVAPVAKMITPVPGGVGPMTIASLMEQTVDLTEWSHNG